MKILRFFTLGLLLIPTVKAEPPSFPFPGITPEASFCIAYVIRDADARDSRPAPDDPFATNGEALPDSVLNSNGNVVDVAALASLVTGQARLTKEQISVAYKAVFEEQSRFPVMECYDPHHLIVCYSESGKPLSCIEICFTCNAVKSSSEAGLWRKPGSVEHSDLIALARIFTALKLPLTPFESFEALKVAKENDLTRQVQYDREKAAIKGENPIK